MLRDEFRRVVRSTAAYRRRRTEARVFGAKGRRSNRARRLPSRRAQVARGRHVVDMLERLQIHCGLVAVLITMWIRPARRLASNRRGPRPASWLRRRSRRFAIIARARAGVSASVSGRQAALTAIDPIGKCAGGSRRGDSVPRSSRFREIRELGRVKTHLVARIFAVLGHQGLAGSPTRNSAGRVRKGVNDAIVFVAVVAAARVGAGVAAHGDRRDRAGRPLRSGTAPRRT